VPDRCLNASAWGGTCRGFTVGTTTTTSPSRRVAADDSVDPKTAPPGLVRQKGDGVREPQALSQGAHNRQVAPRPE
jgi:hypothetical protein